jgi:hypothetical protein
MIPHISEHVTRRAEPSDAQRSAGHAIDSRALRNADRACCCLARPTVVAIIPPAAGRERATDLLLCGHHYRASRRALAAVGADILDESGMPVTRQATAVPPGR